jgi:hypothetical protein
MTPTEEAVAVPDVDEVLERLVTDDAFKRELAEDPRHALARYELTPDDLSMLASQVASGASGQSAVEQRTSKSAFFALFSQVGDVMGGGEVMHGAGGGGAQGFPTETITPGGGGAQGFPTETITPTGGGGDDAGIIINWKGPGLAEDHAAGGGGSGDDAGIVINWKEPGLADDHLGGPDTTPADQFGDGSVMPGDEQGIIIEGGKPADGEVVGFHEVDGPQPHLAEGPAPHLADPGTPQ